MEEFKVAVVFHGNGVYEGTETTEGVAMLCGLSRIGAEVQVFAPNRDQYHVVNHLTGEEQEQKRNIMEESARIARGDCKDLKSLEVDDFDALFIPGGFGAAKNLSSFGFKGAEMTVDENLEKVIKDFYTAKKHIGMSCIAPILIAKVLGSDGVKITLGGKGENFPYDGALDVASSFGAEVEQMDMYQVCSDTKNNIFTAPAYMQGNAKPHHVFDNIENLVQEVYKAFQNKSTE